MNGRSRISRNHALNAATCSSNPNLTKNFTATNAIMIGCAEGRIFRSDAPFAIRLNGTNRKRTCTCANAATTFGRTRSVSPNAVRTVNPRNGTNQYAKPNARDADMCGTSVETNPRNIARHANHPNGTKHPEHINVPNADA